MKLDLIQELLTHRQSIVSSMLENSDRLLSSSSNDPYGTTTTILSLTYLKSFVMGVIDF